MSNLLSKYPRVVESTYHRRSRIFSPRIQVRCTRIALSKFVASKICMIPGIQSIGTKLLKLVYGCIWCALIMLHDLYYLSHFESKLYSCICLCIFRDDPASLKANWKTQFLWILVSGVCLDKSRDLQNLLRVSHWMELCNFHWKEYQRTIGFRWVSVRNDRRHYVRHSRYYLVNSTEPHQSLWNSENGFQIVVDGTINES